MTQSKPNKCAVITGASRGIGKAAAEELRRSGYSLLLCARSIEELKSVKQNIIYKSGEAYAVRCDVSQADDVAELAETAKELFGHVDLLFNNAGSGRIVSLSDTTKESWDQTIGASLTGTFLCCREFLPLLKSAPAPIIINNASVAANRGFTGFSAYSAAKGGVAAFSRSIREELRADGIRVSVLYMGAVNSHYWDDQNGEWDRSKMMSCHTVGQVIANIANLPPGAEMEEIHLMPVGGAL